MSSTNRGATRSPLDFYRTPAWCVRALWATCPHLRGVTEVYDPACGDGAILLALRDMDPVPGLHLYGSDVDMDRACEAAVAGFRVKALDYLSTSAGPMLGYVETRSAVVMNPPYSLAEQFVRRALDIGHRARPVAALLRIAFLASQGRADWLATDAPDVYVLPRRPDFTGGGGDSADYAWMVWPAGPARTSGTVRVVPLEHCANTPAEMAAIKTRKAALRAAEKRATEGRRTA